MKNYISRILCLCLALLMVFGLVACSANAPAAETEAKQNEVPAAAETSEEKVVLNVINYHVGTDYAAEYYAYLFDAFQKTEAGKNRIVPIPPSIPELKGFLQQWCTDTGSGRLFPMRHQKFREDIFDDALEAAHIEPTGLTPHCTRHTFASLSSASGIKPESLQKIIGHANYATTAEVYIHQDITKLIDEMRKIKR